MGTGNGDPTDHEPDGGSSRKAFNGLCMALVQSTKQAGAITVDAESPGLAPSRVTISSRSVELRPQVTVWEREVPAGPGITGLWRPAPPVAGAGGGIYTFRQNGNTLTGTIEGAGGTRRRWRNSNRHRKREDRWRRHLFHRRRSFLQRHHRRRRRRARAGGHGRPGRRPRPASAARSQRSGHRSATRWLRPVRHRDRLRDCRASRRCRCGRTWAHAPAHRPA